MAAKPPANKTVKSALAKNPSSAGRPTNAPDAIEGLTRVSAGVYRNAQGQKVNASGARIDNYGRVSKVGSEASTTTQSDNVDVNRINTRIEFLKKHRPNDPEIGKLQAKLKGTSPSSANPAAATPAPANPLESTTPGMPNLYTASPDQRMKVLGGGAAELTGQTIAGNLNYNPATGNTAYNPTFNEQSQKAYNAVLNQFDTSTKAQFDQQDAEFQQRMAEQGIDPNSGRWKIEYNNIKQQQNQARQQAMNSAQDASMSVQNQFFNQSQQTAMTPTQMAATMSGFITAPWEMQHTQAQDQATRDAQLRAAGISASAGVNAAKINAQGGITQQQIQTEGQQNIAAMNALQQNQNQNRLPTPNPWNTFATGLGQGAGAAGTKAIIG